MEAIRQSLVTTMRVAITLVLSAALLAGTSDAGTRSLSGAQVAKLRTAQQVYDDLILAVGDGRTRPRLRLLPADQVSDMGAVWFEPQQGAILLEERAYDVLVSGSDSLDALAFILGHELAHYYRGHDWTGDFVRGFADLEVGRTLKGLAGSTRRAVECEAEADYFSGFYGRMAGYSSLAAASGALQRIYREYDLADRSPGYPSLSERQAMAARTAIRLREFIPVFDAGNWLLLIGQYAEAASCFDYVGRTFPSREILNNAGVARALAAIEFYGAGRLSFVYPLELDASTRLRGAGKADHYEWEESARERRERLLRDARGALELAHRRDPKYATAVVNLACVADLQGNHDEAVVLARQAIELARANRAPLSLANAWIVQGIGHARAQPADTSRARHCFGQALEASRHLAHLNLVALAGEESETSAPVAAAPSRGEVIDGLAARDYDLTLSQPDVRIRVPPIFEEETALTFYSKVTADWSSLVIDTGYSTLSFRSMSEAGHQATARSVTVGASVKDVSAAYGPATSLVSGRQATHLLYRSARIVFSTDGSDVVGWTIYDVE